MRTVPPNISNQRVVELTAGTGKTGGAVRSHSRRLKVHCVLPILDTVGGQLFSHRGWVQGKYGATRDVFRPHGWTDTWVYFK